MKYVALLRGINVGGNNIIKMKDLVRVFEKAGYTSVATFIQSGNVVFESNKRDKYELVSRIESMLSAEFHYSSKVVIRSQDELTGVLNDVPPQWKKDDDVRCYIAFVKEPATATDIAKEVDVKEGIDELSVGEGVLYMSTKMEGLTKSKFVKFIGKKSYKDVTMRNYKTSRMILELMQK